MAEVNSFYTHATPRLLSVLRIVSALIFIEHGTAKLLGFPSSDMMPPVGSLFWFGGILEMVGGALLLLATPPRWLHWVALLDLAFAVGSLGALLIATTVGMFGFVETTTATLWWETLWVEIAAIVVLGALFVVARGRRT